MSDRDEVTLWECPTCGRRAMGKWFVVCHPETPEVPVRFVRASHNEGGERRPRAFLHEDGRYVSIGFTDTPDTLLPVPDSMGWRDRERLAEWAAALAVPEDNQ